MLPGHSKALVANSDRTTNPSLLPKEIFTHYRHLQGCSEEQGTAYHIIFEYVALSNRRIQILRRVFLTKVY